MKTPEERAAEMCACTCGPTEEEAGFHKPTCYKPLELKFTVLFRVVQNEILDEVRREREACAKIADEFAADMDRLIDNAPLPLDATSERAYRTTRRTTALKIARAIRARGRRGPR